MELLKSLSIKNNFHYHKDRTQKVETIKLTMNEEVRFTFEISDIFVQLVNFTILPSVYMKHMCFVNITPGTLLTDF